MAAEPESHGRPDLREARVPLETRAFVFPHRAPQNPDAQRKYLLREVHLSQHGAGEVAVPIGGVGLAQPGDGGAEPLRLGAAAGDPKLQVPVRR